ncbi:MULTISPECIES: hypothetical protein [unclassified Microcoleus]|uniref:hypothetical protein n=1 Tax=unclassified Microcoleus TaxID=2642155 RepID=UPI002FCF4FC6
MQTVEALHREAMELVDRAVLARQCGDIDQVTALTRAAFAKERAAADLVANEWDFEPTRSILHRSAAVLGIECAQLRQAERLIGRALAGSPPTDIADELRDLLISCSTSKLHFLCGLSGPTPTPHKNLTKFLLCSLNAQQLTRNLLAALSDWSLIYLSVS